MGRLKPSSKKCTDGSGVVAITGRGFMATTIAPIAIGVGDGAAVGGKAVAISRAPEEIPAPLF